jgi:UDP:flavonoid glycosyltransferase YjiC (YdhE family)
MEPFLTIGELLKEKGHQVICAFPEQFRPLAEDANLEFASLGSGYINLLESDLGKAAMGEGGSGLKKFTANIKLASHQTEINKELARKQYEILEREEPDRVVYNSQATYPVLWGMEKKGEAILISALPYMHYVKGNTHIVFNSDFGPLLNKLTYSLADFGRAVTVDITRKWLNLPGKIPRKQIINFLLSGKTIYTISPSLFKRPDTWGENLKVLGFHQRDKTKNWEPDKDLVAFLERHMNDRILLVTFGSMTNPEPESKTRTIVDILERNKIPAIINTASGGLVRPDTATPEWLHFVSQIPYEWIFPKVYGVIHHGGSGTTHLALKYGCATMIIPHIVDQFVWNRIVSGLGAGPAGIKITKINTVNLEPKILDLVTNDSYKKKAEQIERQLQGEDLREELYKAIVE